MKHPFRASRKDRARRSDPTTSAAFLSCLLRKILSYAAVLVYALFFAWVLFFAVAESFPKILNVLPLGGIRYFAIKERYVSDPDLVFVYRKENRVVRQIAVGDLFNSNYGIPAEPRNYTATYEHGFRKNSSQSPFDIAVVGDSYVEIGEDDESTFPELLKRETGLSVMNLGRAWYGPYQYLELLRREIPRATFRYVLFCFFAGNDLDDMRQYERWKNRRGDYYFYKNIDERNILARFAIATKDTLLLLREELKPTAPEFDRLGLINLGGRKVAMAFRYWERAVSDEQIASLRGVLSGLKSVSAKGGIVPVVVYIPTAIQVYGDLHSADSNRGFLKKLATAPDNPSLRAVARTAGDLDLQFVNLLPVFKMRAAQGRLLYYPFDTHWNVEGRKTAASVIGRYLLDRRRDSKGTDGDGTTELKTTLSRAPSPQRFPARDPDGEAVRRAGDAGSEHPI